MRKCHTEREQQQQQALARLTAAQQQLQTVTLQLHSEQSLLAQRLHELAHTAQCAAVAAANIPVGYVLQVQPVEVAMSAVQAALAYRAQHWQQSDAQLQAARAQCSVAAVELQAAQASTATAAGNYTLCCNAVTQLQERMAAVSQRVTQQSAAVDTAQQHAAAMQAAAAQQLQRAEQLQQCSSGGELNGERIAVTVSVDKRRAKIRAATDAVRRLALDWGVGNEGSSAALQQQLHDATAAFDEKRDAIRALQAAILERTAAQKEQMRDFTSRRL
jgi:hypothetical protein